MKICLVSALTRLNAANACTVPDLEDAPLGPLTLAAIFQAQGADVVFVDLDWEYAHRNGDSPATSFLADMARRLVSLGADVYGFSTVCGSYPVTLRLARELKTARPDCTTVLGGPQASVVDLATLANFQQIDYILRGEADQSFAMLLDALGRSRGSLHFVPGLSWRNGRLPQRNADAPLVEDLDALPLPAYSLYRDLESASCVSLELGRGCPFACSFCSTNDFFRRRFRLKSPERVIGQMKELHARYGVRRFSLVHDMFTVDRRRVAAFCEAMIASGSGFRWSCSARTDCVDEELLALMADAGCNGIFYGIETGSARLQKIIRKSLDVKEALQIVTQTSKRGISSTASAITGFPDESPQDFRETVDFLLEAARLDDVEVQLHLLAPLAGTPIAREYAGRLMLDRTQSDFSTGKLLSGEEWDWIERCPEIFSSFYHVPVASLNRSFLADFSRFLWFGMRAFRWLLIAVHQTMGRIEDVFAAYQQSPEHLSDDSLTGFRDFVRARFPHPAIEAICYLQCALERPSGSHSTLPGPACAAPKLSDHVRIVSLPFDLGEWLACLSRGALHDFCDRTPSTIALLENRKQRVLKLHPLQARILALCDGTRTLDKLSGGVEWDFGGEWPGVPCEIVVSVILEALAQDGIIVWRLATSERISRQTPAAVSSHPAVGAIA